MEVVPKRASIVKEEREMDSCGSVEEVEKIGSEKKTGGGSLKSSSPNQRYSSTSNKVSTVIASERSSMDTSSRSSPSNTKGPTPINNQEDQLESTKAEMGEVREDNERLKALLARIAKDYQSLQMHFLDIVQQEQGKKPAETPAPAPAPHDVEEPDHLVSLSLGMNSSVKYKKEAEKPNSASKNKENDQIEEGLALGLDCKYKGSSNFTNTMSLNNSVEETKEVEGTGEPWPPSKILKNTRSGPEDEVSQQAHVKKTRVSVRARCDAPTMHDGCQWRKYGQKIAKGNPCPRAYYRCTVAAACPVRKQVQRCSEDMSILITTYEGTHNHPLPISATTMASATSAAACMLMSGSSTSTQPVISASPWLPTANSTVVSSSNPNLHALNFNLTDPNSQLSHPFYLPNPTISSTPYYPTITLDLTSPPHPSSQPSQFSRIFSSSNFTTSSSGTPRYSTSFNFSSSDSNISTSLPTSWANGPYLSYAAPNQPHTKSPIGSLGLNASNQQDNLYQSFLQKVVNPMIGGGVAAPHVLTNTIAKAITSDPSFQSALATAITSYVGGGTNAAQNSTAAAVNGCGSSFLSRTGSGSASSTRQGINSLMFMQNTPLAFSSPKSTSASPVDNRENIN